MHKSQLGAASVQTRDDALTSTSTAELLQRSTQRSKIMGTSTALAE